MVYWRKRRPKWLEFLGLKEKQEDLVKWRTFGLSLVALLALVSIVTIQEQALAQQSHRPYALRSVGRRLLQTENGTEPSHCEFEESHIPEAWVFSHCICIVIIFIALAIICDDFFVPSLEIISEKLNLSEDVAGATFMAAGSSAPELFTSVAGVAQETDVGVGTIVGSAVFNLLIIIALTAALAGQVLHLDWRPLMRDSFFYAMSIGCFIGFVWDGYFQHYEAACLLSLYILYIVLMIFNPKIMDWMGTWKVCCKSEVSPSEDDAEKASDAQTQLNHTSSKGDLSNANGKERRMSLTGGHARRISIIHRERSHSEERIFHHKRGSVAGVLICPPPKHLTHSYLNRKDSGFQNHENNFYNASSEGAEGNRGGAPEGQTGDRFRSPLVKNGFLTTKSGTPSEDIEMTTVENPSYGGAVKDEVEEIHGGKQRVHERRQRNRRTYSEDCPGIREDMELGDHRKLQRSLSSEQSRTTDLYYGPPAAPKLPPIAPHSNNDSETSLTNPSNNQSSSNPDTPSGSTHTCNSAQALVSDGQEPQSVDHDLANPDLCSSESALQTSQLPKKAHDDSATPEDNKDGKEEPEEGHDEEEEETMNICPCMPCCPVVRTHPPSTDSIREEGGCWNWTKFILRWIIFIPAFPFVCLFSWTIPDCSKDHLKKYYILSFIMSVAWIAGLSFAMVTIVERTGCILNIDTYIMGLVIVAIGTSIPDALSSILVARDGYGDMAVSNAIGSNVFDINLGLGLPFIIRICIDRGAPITLLDSNEWVDLYDGTMRILPHAKFGFILLLILFLALMIFSIVRYKLNKWIGITFVLMYIFFLTYAFIQELYCYRQLGLYC